MAVLTAYSLQCVERGTDDPRILGDLLGGGQGPDLAGILRQILIDDAEYPAAPPAGQPRREVFWTVDGTPSSTIDGEDHDIVLWGRLQQTKDEPALTKIRRATGRSFDFERGDPGERPLFFLVSAPHDSEQALVIAERAGSYTQTSFWRHEIKREIQAMVTRPLKSDPTRQGPAVTVEFAKFGDRTPGDYYEDFAEGVLEARAINYLREDGEKVGESQVRLTYRQEPDKGRMRRLLNRGDRDGLTQTLFGNFVQVPTTPDEFEVVADINGRAQVLAIGRDRIGFLGKRIPPNAPLDDGGRFVDPEHLVALAVEWAREIGHQQGWVMHND